MKFMKIYHNPQHSIIQLGESIYKIFKKVKYSIITLIILNLSILNKTI